MRSEHRFTDRAAEYVTGRPDYPARAIDALLEGFAAPGAIDVADIGAGTGISSRALAGRGCRVVAVEPNAAMRERIETSDHVRACDGTAERTGLESAAFELVTAFQAFHWFDAPRAITEMIRIAQPRGRIALVYNSRDDGEPVTQAYSAIVRAYANDGAFDAVRRTHGIATFCAHAGFRSVRRETFEHVQALDRDGVRARAMSTSYLPKEGSQARALQAALDVFFATHERDGRISMRLNTTVAIASVP